MFRVGSRFARLSFVSIVATAILGGATMKPAFAQAGSHRWRLVIVSLPSMRTVSSLYSAAYCLRS